MTLKPICRRCGTYMNVLINGYVCPNCKYQEVVISSDKTTSFETVPTIDVSRIRVHTDGEQVVWTREELVELIKEVVKEMEDNYD